MSVNAYPGATHAWDRLMVPIVVTDPFADQGSYFSTGVVPSVQFTPDVDQAFESRVRFRFASSTETSSPDRRVLRAWSPATRPALRAAPGYLSTACETRADLSADV